MWSCYHVLRLCQSGQEVPTVSGKFNSNQITQDHCVPTTFIFLAGSNKEQRDTFKIAMWTVLHILNDVMYFMLRRSFRFNKSLYASIIIAIACALRYG